MIENELTTLLEIARTSAREAGNLVLSGWRTAMRIEKKGRIDLVTTFDRESESLLRTRLKPTGLAFVGEEEGGTEAQDAPTWYVDPIDGTTNFARGHFFFCVSVGLLHAGRPILGVVVAPALGVEWSGFAGGPALRNNEPCHVTQTSVLDDSLLATGFPYDRRTSEENNFRTYVHMKRRTLGIRRCGSAALDLCLVADGTYDGYWETKLKPWDLAAGAAIVLAAGGTVTNYEGRGVDLRKGQLVATNGLIHRELLEEIAASRTAKEIS